jgi:hypothetical protein
VDDGRNVEDVVSWRMGNGGREERVLLCGFERGRFGDALSFGSEIPFCGNANST